MIKKRMGHILILFVIFSFYISNSFAWEIDEQGKVTNIVDGDTFDIDNGERIRLADTSAPEPGESGGSEATSILTSLINGKTVYIDTDPQRNYGRLVAVVYVKHNSTHYKNINKVYPTNIVLHFTWTHISMSSILLLGQRMFSTIFHRHPHHKISPQLQR